MNDEKVHDSNEPLTGVEGTEPGAPKFAVDKIVGIVALVVVAAGAGYWAASRQAPPPAPPAASAPAAAPQISPGDAVILAEAKIKTEATAENYLNLSLAYFRAGRFMDTITAAKEAIKLRPNYAEAWNNIAAGYQGLEQWDEAIQASQQALKINPDLQIAKNNLAYSLAQKQKQPAAKK